MIEYFKTILSKLVSTKPNAMPRTPGRPAPSIAEPPKPPRRKVRETLRSEVEHQQQSSLTQEVQSSFKLLVQNAVEVSIAQNTTDDKSCFVAYLLEALAQKPNDCLQQDTPVIGEQLCIEVTPASPPLFAPKTRRMIKKTKRRSAVSIRDLEISDDDFNAEGFYECTE